MPDGLEDYIESISEEELREMQKTDEEVEYFAMLQEEYEKGQATRQTNGQP